MSARRYYLTMALLLLIAVSLVLSLGGIVVGTATGNDGMRVDGFLGVTMYALAVLWWRVEKLERKQ